MCSIALSPLFLELLLSDIEMIVLFGLLKGKVLYKENNLFFVLWVGGDIKLGGDLRGHCFAVLLVIFFWSGGGGDTPPRPMT